MKNKNSEIKTNRLPVAEDSSLEKFLKVLPFILISAICFCAYYLLNRNTPPFGDDMFSKFVFQGWYTDKITNPRVTSISQIFEGMAVYYKTFRGRVIAQGLTQLFAVYGKQTLYNKPCFNILNSLIFTGIAFLVYYHSNYEKKTNWRLYLIICATFWFLTPDMMALVLWMAGSLNECWVVFFVLLFLVPYRKLVSKTGEVQHPTITALLLIPIGFLAGAFNFQSFGLSIGFAVLATILVMIRKRKVPYWSFIGLISTLCGTLFVLLAPGNKVECLNKYGMTPAELFFDKFPDNIFDAFSMSYKVTKVLLLFSVIILAWLIMEIRKRTTVVSAKKKNKKEPDRMFSFKSFIDNKNGLLIPGLFSIAAAASVVVAFALPYVADRLFFTVFVCFALVLFSLLSETLSRIESAENKLRDVLFNKYVRIAVPVLIALVTVVDFGKEYRIYHQHFEIYSDVVYSIEEKIDRGERDIVIHKKTGTMSQLLPERRINSFVYFWSVTGMGSSGDANAKENRWYAYYFGADTLVGIK